jgi:2-dehydropantoate 2-reductase
MAARATWKGYLKVSLVNIPVKVFPATESSATLSFNQLHNVCQTRIQQKRWCPTCNKEVANTEIAKGYEFEKGHYVIVSEEDIEKVRPTSTRVIDLVQFDDAAALDPMYVDRTYYLAPDGQVAADAFAVMREGMKGKIGVGGVVGARLAQHGHAVALIARGKHYDVIRERGLRLESPDAVEQINLSVFDHPARITWTKDDVVLLAMKSQDTFLALEDLASIAPPDTPIVCLQNGVANERMALRRFPHVYGVCVYCAAGHLVPGVVQTWSVPMPGILDIRRYPSAADPFAEEVAAVLRGATFHSEARADIMRWKYRKLLMNLGNAAEALCGASARGNAILAEARREGVACLAAAGIPFVSEEGEEDPARREKRLELRQIDGLKRQGGSSWQSLARATRSIEADYLNGEIVLLGRIYGVPTPVNQLLQRLAKEAAREGKPPGSTSIEELTENLKLETRN